jgi:hypothetical protein
MLKMRTFILLISSLLVSESAFGQQWQAESADKQVAVMELFVSEGCGLCPAAERWVDQLPEQGITENELIVLGFHVDYLDDKKGWIDRFAKPRYTERQRQMARLNLYQTVFTPEIFISGEVVHNWREHGTDVIEFINSFDSEADISLTVKKTDETLNIDTEVTVFGDENQANSQLYLALTEDNIISEIHGGDNIGAVFNHQNLVRRWLGPFELNSDGDPTQIQSSLPLDPSWKLHDLTLVAIVQNLDNAYVLQGLSLPLKAQ